MEDLAMQRRVFLKIAGIGTASLTCGAGMADAATPVSTRMTSVVEQFDWIANSRILGEVVAQNLGYYEDEGIRFSIALGGPHNTGVASVASGYATLGLLSSSPTLMAARAGDIPLKCIAAGFQRHPLTFYSLPDNPIRSPQDMRGKRIGIARPGFNLVRAVMRKNGIPEDEVQIVALGGDIAPLFNGQVDAISAWATDATKLKPLGPDRVALSLWDSGVQLYANPYYTTDTMLRERPEVIAAFMRGTARGWAYARGNPEQAVDILVRSYPMLDRNGELFALRVALSFVFDEQTKMEGWGTMKKDTWADQIRLFASIGQFSGQDVPTVDDVMTLSILNATADQRPKIG
ncbi:ABC transporter substrate-binding protein [Gluconacetobacter asukensis]|nr:ABC transporter substrate-binding protein [Gluconacetobacter asukensis]